MDGHENCRVEYRKVAAIAAKSIRREEEFAAEVESLRAENGKLRAIAQEIVDLNDTGYDRMVRLRAALDGPTP